MHWTFLNTGSHTGQYNMDFDLRLVRDAIPGEAVFRLYRWQPYCISLGANQKIESILVDKAAADNIDVVTRPTGGRAILHAEEITYSVIYPLEKDTSARQLYKDINLALVEGLKLYNSKLAEAELENIQPDFQNFYKQDISAICFAVPAKSELKFNGRKLAGSAQRKMDKAILQHGSILCGKYHEKIIDYLNFQVEDIPAIKKEMDEKTIDVKSIINEDVNYARLAECLKKGFENFYGITFLNNEPVLN